MKMNIGMGVSCLVPIRVTTTVVITVRGDEISAITAFSNTTLLTRFGLARTLAD